MTSDPVAQDLGRKREHAKGLAAQIRDLVIHQILAQHAGPDPRGERQLAVGKPVRAS